MVLYPLHIIIQLYHHLCADLSLERKEEENISYIHILVICAIKTVQGKMASHAHQYECKQSYIQSGVLEQFLYWECWKQKPSIWILLLQTKGCSCTPSSPSSSTPYTFSSTYSGLLSWNSHHSAIPSAPWIESEIISQNGCSTASSGPTPNLS